MATWLGVHSVGLRQIDPRNLRWLSEDPAQVFFGAQSYRLATRFSPFAFRTDLFGYPGSISVGLFDPMPLIALLVRLLSPLLPTPFQYDGLYLALCFVLQGVTAFALMRVVIGRGRPAAVALAALLLLLTPPFVTRTYGHVALSSHWVILAALAIYLHAARRRAMPWAACAAVIVLAAGINVYISIISLCIVMAAAIHHLPHRGDPVRARHLAAAAGLVLLNFACFNLFGYVTLADWPVLSTNNLGRYSANLLTFFSAPGEGLLFRMQHIDPDQQGEGFGYLGLGVFVLATVAVARDPRAVGLAIRRHAPLVAAGILLFAWATMNRVRFGSTTLFVVPFPAPIRGILGSLQSNGRFVWLLMYLIPVLAVTALAGEGSKRALIVILAVAVVLQAPEVVPIANQLHQVHKAPSVEYADAVGLRFAPSVRNFVALPPWQCGGTAGPSVPGHGVPMATFQAYVSLLNGLHSNSQYTARTPLGTQQPWCNTDIVPRLGPFRTDTAYYLSPALYRQVVPSARAAHWCDLLYGGVLCRPDAARAGESPASRALRAGLSTPAG